MDEVIPERAAAPVQQPEQPQLRRRRAEVVVVQGLVADAVESHVGARPVLRGPGGGVAAERTEALRWLLLQLPLALHLG